MANVSSFDIAKVAAKQFGLIVAENPNNGPSGRSCSLLFVGNKATEATFKKVLAHMLTEYDAIHQFRVESDFPGIHVRGLTPFGSVVPIYLVVVSAEPASYVSMPQAMR